MFVRRLVLRIDHPDAACIHQLGCEAVHLQQRRNLMGFSPGSLSTWPAAASRASASFLLPEVLPVATRRAVLTTRFEKFTRAADFESNTWWEGC